MAPQGDAYVLFRCSKVAEKIIGEGVLLGAKAVWASLLLQCEKMYELMGDFISDRVFFANVDVTL